MSYHSVVATDTPIAWWRLEDAAPPTAVDSADGNPGSYAGGLTPGAAGILPGEPGDTSTAFVTDISKFVDIPYAALFDVTYVSVEVWIKNVAAQNGGFLDKTIGGNTNAQYQLFQQGGSIFWRLNGASDITWALSDGALHHVVGTYDRTTSKLYVDGALVASVAYTAPLATGNGHVFIGKLGNNVYPLGGNLQEIALYDFALTSGRVTAHYDAGVTPPAPTVYSYTASGGIVFGGDADTHRPAIQYSYNPTGGVIFGGAASIDHIYKPSGGIVFGGEATIVPHVAQIRFDIFRALNAPFPVFFDILSDIPSLNTLPVEFDVFEATNGVAVSFDIYPASLHTARTSEDVQMPIADVEFN
jgi:hypothetical protein